MATGPRSINCYLVEVLDFTAAAPGGEGKKFKIVTERLLYLLQWLHTTARRLILICSSCAIRRSGLISSSRCCSASFCKHDPQPRERLGRGNGPSPMRQNRGATP